MVAEAPPAVTVAVILVPAVKVPVNVPVTEVPVAKSCARRSPAETAVPLVVKVARPKELTNSTPEAWVPLTAQIRPSSRIMA